MKKAMISLGALCLVILASAMVTAETQEASAISAAPAARRAVYQVKNITCGACFSNINQALAGEQGFAGMGVNLLRKLVAVDFKPPLTPEKIGAAIAGAGYPATLDRVETLEEKETFAHRRESRSPAGGGCCAGAVQSGCPYPGGGPSPEKTQI